MNTEPQIGPPQGAATLPLTAQAVAVEPVTDEDAHEASLSYINDTPMDVILEQDRLRVAERQAGRQGDYNPASLSHEAANAELAHISGTISDAREIERLRAEVAAHRKHDVLRCDALMKAEAEVAKLNAACAAKDAALRLLTDMDELRETDELYIARAALSDTAGKGWIDASGAVEAEAPTVVQDNCDGTGLLRLLVRGELSRVEAMIGSPVLIVRKPK